MTNEFVELNTAGAGQVDPNRFHRAKISGRAGLSGFLHWHQFGALLGKVLPRRDGKVRPGGGGRPTLSRLFFGAGVGTMDHSGAG